MNKLEANISLFIITFFASIQYAFLSGVPETVTDSAFLCITNLIGFIIVFVIFSSELFRINKTVVLQSLILSIELFFFNIFILKGSSGINPTTISCVLSAYFLFVPIIELIAFKIKPSKNVVIGILIVLFGLFMLMDLNIKSLFNINILFIVLGDIVFAAYIITTGRYTVNSNPSILAMGQLFFTFLISLISWIAESTISQTPLFLPSDSMFWGSVIFISFFIRGLYGVVQIFAQRFVTALNTSLIFSTEIIMTMIASPFISAFFAMPREKFDTNIVHWCGALVMIIGILCADPTVFNTIFKKKVQKNV